MANVKIGPSFFKNEFKEYSNWHRALIRELGQNSIDCGSTNLAINIVRLDNGNTQLTCSNDGDVMTENVIVDKLLALGESGKRFENGAVGGFGKAKIIIYYAHQSYTIRSGGLQVVGSGGEYELTGGNPFFDGTESTVVIEGDQFDKLVQAVAWFAACAQWDGELVLNGVVLQTGLRKGSPRRELEFGTVYTNRSCKNKLIVRIHGIPMFSEFVDFDRCVIVELNGKSSEVLTANRDGLKYPYCSELSSFVAELAVDKRSALKPKRVSKYRLFRGAKLQNQVESGRSTLSAILGAESVGFMLSETGRRFVPSGRFVSSGSFACGSAGGLESEPEVDRDWVKSVESDVSGSSLAEEFVLKNDCDMVIPECYVPTSDQFSLYSRRLVGYWAKLMLQLHRMFGHSAEFSVGFLFDGDGDGDDTEAQFERTDEFGVVYYLNPVVVRKQSRSNSKSMAKRFKLTDRDRLLSIAVHEFMHGLGFKHDESGVNKITELFGVVLKRRSEFNWCFK